LTERFNGKEVYLVGTMNQSTMLAQRTKKLIEELKPDTVLVQANDW
jgi:pheromone shutdown protein TraB